MNINSQKKSHFALIFAFVALLLSTATLAYAQENRPEMQNQEMRREAIEDMRESRRVQVSEQVQNRIINLSDNINKRLHAALVRLSNISDRIDSRIEKLKALGVDTSVAEGRLEEAKSALLRAQTGVNSLGSVADVISSDSPRDSFATIRTQFIAIQTALRESRLGFIDTVNLLKEAVAQAEIARGVSSAVTDTPAPDEVTEEAE